MTARVNASFFGGPFFGGGFFAAPTISKDLVATPTDFVISGHGDHPPSKEAVEMREMYSRFRGDRRR
jgi:hypothetical protein